MGPQKQSWQKQSCSAGWGTWWPLISLKTSLLVRCRPHRGWKLDSEALPGKWGSAQLPWIYEAPWENWNIWFYFKKKQALRNWEMPVFSESSAVCLGWTMVRLPERGNSRTGEQSFHLDLVTHPSRQSLVGLSISFQTMWIRSKLNPQWTFRNCPKYLWYSFNLSFQFFSVNIFSSHDDLKEIYSQEHIFYM